MFYSTCGTATDEALSGAGKSAWCGTCWPWRGLHEGGAESWFEGGGVIDNAVGLGPGGASGLAQIGWRAE